MNPDLYTEEFRNFKYLKSSPAQVEYFKRAFAKVNQIQNWATTNDPLFVWPNRIEFLEQLIDLDGKPLYIVYPGFQSTTSEYEQASVYAIQQPLVYEGPLMNPWGGKRILMDDVDKVEKVGGFGFYLCSGSQNSSCIELTVLPIVVPTMPGSTTSIYTALFHDKHTADMYSTAITEYIRSLRR